MDDLRFYVLFNSISVISGRVLLTGQLLTGKLLSQEYRKARVVSTLTKFYGRQRGLDNPNNVTVSKHISDLLDTADTWCCFE